MELRSAEITKLKSLVDDWLAHPDVQELEASFGRHRTVDATTFLAIAQRLKLKGYDTLPQDDRLSIITPNNIRLSLQGLGVLQSYCRDDVLSDKEYTAMIKDRKSLEADLNLPEYELHIKSRRELALAKTSTEVVDILSNWAQTRKAFRLVKRWSFKGHGMRIDMSMVRSTPKDSRGDFLWQRKFTDVNLFEQPVIYEVEVELIHGDKTATRDTAVSCFVRGIGEILRAIQGNTLLLQTSVVRSVLEEYKGISRTHEFRGVAPITLEVKNMSDEESSDEPNIRQNYNVTDKADGLRTHGFCNRQGELFLIDMSMKVYRTGLANKACASSLVDGEWVTRSADGKALNVFLIFDIYIDIGGAPCSSLPFTVYNEENKDTRLYKLTQWTTQWNTAGGGAQEVAKGLTASSKLQVSQKQFLVTDPAKALSIFTHCASILDAPRIYTIDGLILTPNALGLPERAGAGFQQQFKWKPAEDNSIDFLVTFQKSARTPLADEVVVTQDPVTGLDVRYKIMRLYINSDKDPAYDNPRNTVLDELPLPPPPWAKARTRPGYKPVLFNPPEYSDTLVNTCYVPLVMNFETGEEFPVTKTSNEPIQESTIVECRYQPHADPGWRWVPMRIRHDKTERFAKAKTTGKFWRTLNSEKSANSVWESIHNPVTEHMIRTGDGEPSQQEMEELLRGSPGAATTRRYYMREGTRDDKLAARGLRDFHNRWIKETIIYDNLLTVPEGQAGKKVLDLAVGQAGEYGMWIRKRAGIVLGVDIAEEGIRDPKNGAYSRYMSALIKRGRDHVPPMVFAIGDSSKPLRTGEAGSTPEEKNMLRAVFGTTAPDGPVPKAIQLHSNGTLREGADLAVCMFALHYFFASPATLQGFLNNLKDCVAVNGYFAGCCFDGEHVFQMLRSVERGQSKVGRDGTSEIWSIRKEYDLSEFNADESSVGIPVDVRFVSIGEEYTEYLVNFDYLTLRLREIGFELLTPAELAVFPGLKHSTNMFRNSYDMAAAAGHVYNMTNAEKEFSFLNRWFIFKRRSNTNLAAAPPGPAAPAPGLAAPGPAAVALDVSEHTSVRPTPGSDSEITAALALEEVAPSAAAEADFQLPPPNRAFEADKIFMFGPEVELRATDVLKAGDLRANRWLAPYWQFPITDKDTNVTYPSLEHYWEAMKLKLAGNLTAAQKDLPATLLGSNGLIHSKFKARFNTEGRTGEAEEARRRREMDIFREELEEVKRVMTPANLRREYNVTIQDAVWNMAKEKVYREGLLQRFNKDDLYRRMIEGARQQGKYLLYYLKAKKLGGPGDAVGDLSGVRRINKQVEGENKIGRWMMEIAKFKL